MADNPSSYVELLMKQPDTERRRSSIQHMSDAEIASALVSIACRLQGVRARRYALKLARWRLSRRLLDA